MQYWLREDNSLSFVGLPFSEKTTPFAYLLDRPSLNKKCSFSSVKIVLFVTGGGLWNWKMLLFGPTSSAATFQLMEKISHNLR